MKKRIGWLLRCVALLALFVASLGCATAFTGSAHVERGMQGCQAKCTAWGLDLTGMVAMGEYSDACICTVPGQAATATALAGGAVAGGAAGVMMQMQQAQQAQQQAYR